MDHISANLAFGRRKKNIWGYKKLQGGKRNRKKSGDLFFVLFFGDSKKFVGGGKKSSRGAGGANIKVPDMYGVGWVFSGPKTQK